MKILRSKNVTTGTTGFGQRRPVVFSSGALFFTHVIEWPQGLAGADLSAFVALAVEELSPFALDSLAWGFCCDEERRTIFLYAACLPRVSATELERWPLAEHVYPAFVPLIAKREKSGKGQTAHELLLTERELLLLSYGGGGRWPDKIEVEALEEQATQADVLAAAARLLVKAAVAPDADSAQAKLADIPLWQLANITSGKRGEMVFVLRDLRDGASKAQLRTTLAGRETLWQADVRDESFIGFARKQRALGQRLWYGLCAAAVTAAVLLVLLLVSFLLNSLLQKRAITLGSQAAAVERVRQDQDLLMRMRQFSADPFAPFNLVAALKASKPVTIYFDSIELNAPDAVVVEGQGPTVDAVNAYGQSLEKSKFFRTARQTRMNLRDGASVFTLYLQYLGQPPVAEETQEQANAGTTTQRRRRGQQATGASEALPVVAAEGEDGDEEWDVTLSSDLIISPVVSNAQSGGVAPSGAVVVGAPAAANAAQPPVSRWQPHIVNAGDTFASIAERYNIPVSAILETNPNVDPQALDLGQVILIPVP